MSYQRFIALFFSLMVVGIITSSQLCSAEQLNLPWEWSSAEQKRITYNAKRLTKGEDGYWENKFKNISARSNISADMAIEGFYYLETVVETFGKVSGLSFAKSSAGGVQLIIHDQPEQFKQASAAPAGVRCTHRLVTDDSGKTDVIFHVLAAADRSSVNLGSLLPLSELQYECGLAFSQLCTGKNTAPAFLAHGMAEFFSGWDMRLDSYSSATTSVAYGTKDQLIRSLLKEQTFIPTITALVALTPADFAGDKKEQHAALALSYMDFLFGPYGKRYRSVLAKFCSAVEKEGTDHDYAQTLLEEKSLKKMQQEWRQHLCRVAGRSLIPEQFYFEVAGSLPKQPAVNQGGNYGYRPNVLLTPMLQGAYTVVWHDPTEQKIKLIACDAQNKKLATVEPDFLAGARSLLGCAYTGKNNTYVIAYSKDHAVGGKDFAFYLCGITADGTKIFDQLIFGDRAPTETGSKGEPGAAGTGRVIYNDATGTVGYYLAHQQRWPDGVRHQGGYIGSLQPNGTNITKADGWFFSHNFDQRLISSGSSFYALAHGDSYPRALGFSRWNIGGGVLSKQFDIQYYQIPGKGGDNRTDCLTGGVVELNGGKHFGVLFASANERKAQDVCATVMDANGVIMNTKWLTNYKDGQKATFPRIAKYEQHIFAAWEETSGGATKMRMMLMSADLNQVFMDKTYPNLELPTSYDLVNLTDGSIAWVVPHNGKLLVNRIDLSDKVQGDLYNQLKSRAGFEG